MKFIALAGLATLPGLVLPQPLSGFPFNAVPRSDVTNRVLGATYFISNEPDGNYIIASAMRSDGQLTLANGIWAGGKGLRGTHSPVPGTDPLFSQGAVTVSGKNLYTINSGSNTVIMFEIDNNDPTKLQMIGQPTESGGEFPVSIAVSKKTGLVCVLNGGAVSSVNCFKQNGAKGLVQVPDTLRLIDLGNQTTPPAGPADTVSQVIFNEAETQLIASVKGVPPQPGYLAIWDIDAKTGALSKNFAKVSPAAGGMFTFSLTLLPNKNAVLATDPAIGYSIFDLTPSTKFRQNRSGTYPVPGQKALCWSTFSHKTGNTYIIDSDGATISEVRVDNNLQPTIVNQYALGNNSFPLDGEIATVGGKDFLYVLAANTQTVYVMSLDAPGKATIVQQMPFADDVTNMGLFTDQLSLQGMATYVVS